MLLCNVPKIISSNRSLKDAASVYVSVFIECEIKWRSRGPGSIPGTTKKKKSSGTGTGSTQPREYK
jgi:hypothetical protein